MYPKNILTAIIINKQACFAFTTHMWYTKQSACEGKHVLSVSISIGQCEGRAWHPLSKFWPLLRFWKLSSNRSIVLRLGNTRSSSSMKGKGPCNSVSSKIQTWYHNLLLASNYKCILRMLIKLIMLETVTQKQLSYCSSRLMLRQHGGSQACFVVVFKHLALFFSMLVKPFCQSFFNQSRHSMFVNQ